MAERRGGSKLSNIAKTFPGLFDPSPTTGAVTVGTHTLPKKRRINVIRRDVAAKQLHQDGWPRGLARKLNELGVPGTRFGIASVTRVASGTHAEELRKCLLVAERDQAKQFAVCALVVKQQDGSWELDCRKEAIYDCFGLPEEGAFAGAGIVVYDQPTVAREPPKPPEGVTPEHQMIAEVVTFVPGEPAVTTVVEDRLVEALDSGAKRAVKAGAAAWTRAFGWVEAVPLSDFAGARPLGLGAPDCYLLANEGGVATLGAFVGLCACCTRWDPTASSGEGHGLVWERSLLERLLGDGACLGWSLDAAEALLQVEAQDRAAWLARLSLDRPGVLFLSWRDPSTHAVNHEEVSIDTTSLLFTLVDWSTGCPLASSTLAELASHFLEPKGLTPHFASSSGTRESTPPTTLLPQDGSFWSTPEL